MDILKKETLLGLAIVALSGGITMTQTGKITEGIILAVIGLAIIGIRGWLKMK